MSTDEHFPPFLRNVSEEARKEFYEIAHDKKTPLVELRKHMEEWAKKQGDAVVNEMHNFETSKRQHQIATHKKVNVVIGQLTRAHNEVHKIITNDSLSKEEMFEKLRAIDIDPATGPSLRSIILTVAHLHDKHHQHHHHHHSHHTSHEYEYEGMGPLATILVHDESLQIGPAEQQETA